MNIPDEYAPVLGAAMTRVISDWKRDLAQVRNGDFDLARIFEEQLAVCQVILDIADDAL